jgi:hypothetical protein
MTRGNLIKACRLGLTALGLLTVLLIAACTAPAADGDSQDTHKGFYGGLSGGISRP